MAKELGFTGALVCALGVEDIPRSIAWYRETLGFELAFHAEEIGWAELLLPVERVSIGLSEVAETDVRGGGTLVFGVESVDDARAALEGGGVRFDGETVEYPGMVRLATFYDPDGHKLMFFQSLAENHG